MKMDEELEQKPEPKVDPEDQLEAAGWKLVGKDSWCHKKSFDYHNGHQSVHVPAGVCIPMAEALQIESQRK
jgi:hypothetical protein